VLLTQDEFGRMAARAAHELHPRRGLERFAPPPGAPPRVQVNRELYVVASTETLRAHATVRTALSKGAAHDALRELVRTSPGEAGRWQVLSVQEAEAA
jgi:hypothetical protein